MTNLEHLSPNKKNNDLFHLPNEEQLLAHAKETQIFKTAEKQVMHYLLEYVLGVENPYLFTEKGKTPYSYKYLEATRQDGLKTLLPVDYDGQTTFIQLCAAPYEENLKKAESSPPSTAQEERILKRSRAEMLGAENFQAMVSEAPNNSFFIWSSPPGDREDGYWDSSITYLAQVRSTNKNNIREVFCWRCINNLSLEQHVDFLNFFGVHNPLLQLQSKPEDIVLHPQWLTPFEAEKYGIRTINDLIGFLYQYDNQEFDMREIKEQVKKIDALQASLAPQIKNLAQLLRNGHLAQAEKQLNQIEQIALRKFFTARELAEIAYDQDLPENCYLSNQEQIAALAWEMRRQEMEAGGSCPSTSTSSSFLSSLEKIINSGEGEHLCPECHMKFDGNNCPYCSYKLQ